MKKQNITLLFLGTVVCLISVYCLNPFFKNHTGIFLKKYADVNFDEFKGTQFFVRSTRGYEINVYGSKDSITNGLIWFNINFDTLEFLPNSFRFTPSEDSLTQDEKNSLMELKILAPLFVKYRVRHLMVDQKGTVFVGVEDPAVINLIKPTSDHDVPEQCKSRTARKVRDWYLINN